MINNKLVTDKTEIANQFNDFFINIGPELANKIVQAADVEFHSFLNTPCQHQFNFECIDEDTVIKTINAFYGFDYDIAKIIGV